MKLQLVFIIMKNEKLRLELFSILVVWFVVYTYIFINSNCLGSCYILFWAISTAIYFFSCSSTKPSCSWCFDSWRCSFILNKKQLEMFIKQRNFFVRFRVRFNNIDFIVQAKKVLSRLILKLDLCWLMSLWVI